MCIFSDSSGRVQKDIFNKNGNPSYKYYYGSTPGSKFYRMCLQGTCRGGSEIPTSQYPLHMGYRLFAGQGHVTMSTIKIGVSTKWLPEMKRAS